MAASKDIDYRNDGFIGQRMIYMPGITIKNLLKDPRIHDLYITHIGVFPKAKGHLRKRPLGCSQYILIYCFEGEGWVEIQGRRTVLKKNQLYIIEPKTICSYGSSDYNPWTNYWIHYTGPNAAIYSPPLNQVIEIPPSDDARIDERLLLFEEILQNLENYYTPEKVVYANICLKQFLSSIKYLGVYRSVNKENESDTLKKVISYMKNNLHASISVAEFAENCNCSTSNLYKLFKHNTGSSPQDFFIHLKMERARKYLLRTNLKVKEIGAKLGYDDQYYFSRIFRKHVGFSPANYRKEEK